MEWRSLEGPCTRGWWALEHERERMALVQPYQGQAVVVLYNGPHPWKQINAPAATVAQGKKFAERWVRARRKPKDLADAVPTS
jgi:hypothetical protein